VRVYVRVYVRAHLRAAQFTVKRMLLLVMARREASAAALAKN
jgi:hypothetical protein